VRVQRQSQEEMRYKDRDMAKKHTTREMRSQRRTQKKIGLENALRER
jgi:hypothetical protein